MKIKKPSIGELQDLMKAEYATPLYLWPDGSIHKESNMKTNAVNNVSMIANEVRSKSSTRLTELEKLRRDIGFWQDQYRRLEEKMHETKTDEKLECIELLHLFVLDVLPQAGNLAIQDYAGLNEGMILAERILSQYGLLKNNLTINKKKGKK